MIEDRRVVFKFQTLIPFLALFVTNVMTAFGTINVLTAEIGFLSQTVERHEMEIRIVRKDINMLHRDSKN